MVRIPPLSQNLRQYAHWARNGMFCFGAPKPRSCRGLLAGSLRNFNSHQKTRSQRVELSVPRRQSSKLTFFITLSLCCAHSQSSATASANSPALASEVKTAERKAASAGLRGVPQISLEGTIVANGAQQEQLLADSILRILGTTGQCGNGLCAV